mgnify:CR=1 FL=1
MPYPLKTGIMYMMPTHFGPYTGPRRGPDGQTFSFVDSPKKMTYSVRFLTNANQLEPLLPPGFSLKGDPVVNVFIEQMTEIEWLAGRGYNTLGVTFPVRYEGTKDRASGPFLSVLWENLADPILTGREQLGFSKIYCEIPEPVVRADETHLTASWLGYRFMDLRLTGMTELANTEIPTNPAALNDKADEGWLHYKYIPKTGVWGVADAEYACLMPFSGSNEVTKQIWRGDGTVSFHRARWEDLPTQYSIVNTFADLEIIEWQGATITRSTGGKDLSDTRALQ